MPIFDPSLFNPGDYAGGYKDHPLFGLWVRAADTCAYTDAYPIPLPDGWNEEYDPDDAPEVDEYMVLYQAMIKSKPEGGVWRGALGPGKFFSLMGTYVDSKGRIWGQIAGNRWILLYDHKRRLYLTTWRMK